MGSRGSARRPGSPRIARGGCPLRWFETVPGDPGEGLEGRGALELLGECPLRWFETVPWHSQEGKGKG